METVEYPLPEHERIYPCCNGVLHEMSKEIRRALNITRPWSASLSIRVTYTAVATVRATILRLPSSTHPCPTPCFLEAWPPHRH